MRKALVSLHHLTMRVIRAHKTSLTQQFALKCMYQASKMSVLGVTILPLILFFLLNFGNVRTV